MYIENRKALSILTESLNLAAKPRTWLHGELTTQLKAVKSARRFDWESTSGWDCGRQDAMGDMIDATFRRWVALKAAWRIQNGDARDLKRLTEKVTGDI